MGRRGFGGEYKIEAAKLVTERGVSVAQACGGPDQPEVAGRRYLWTAKGWLSVAVVLDLFSRRGGRVLSVPACSLVFMPPLVRPIRRPRLPSSPAGSSLRRVFS